MTDPLKVLSYRTISTRFGEAYLLVLTTNSLKYFMVKALKNLSKSNMAFMFRFKTFPRL